MASPYPHRQGVGWRITVLRALQQRRVVLELFRDGKSRGVDLAARVQRARPTLLWAGSVVSADFPTLGDTTCSLRS